MRGISRYRTFSILAVCPKSSILDGPVIKIKWKGRARGTSHVLQLLNKLPSDLEVNFQRFIYERNIKVPNHQNLAKWLEYEMKVRANGGRMRIREYSPPVVLNTTMSTPVRPQIRTAGNRGACPYCDHSQHDLNHCDDFKTLSTERKRQWIMDMRRCWRCG